MDEKEYSLPIKLIFPYNANIYADYKLDANMVAELCHRTNLDLSNIIISDTIVKDFCFFDDPIFKPRKANILHKLKATHDKRYYTISNLIFDGATRVLTSNKDSIHTAIQELFKNATCEIKTTSRQIELVSTGKLNPIEVKPGKIFMGDRMKDIINKLEMQR